MPSVKPGRKQYQVLLKDGSEVQTTLLEWAQKRDLKPGRAIVCIIADWSDAMNGKVNPFALAIAANAGAIVGPSIGQPLSSPPPVQEQELSPEEKARQEALLKAAEQF